MLLSKRYQNTHICIAKNSSRCIYLFKLFLKKKRNLMMKKMFLKKGKISAGFDTVNPVAAIYLLHAVQTMYTAPDTMVHSSIPSRGCLQS